MSNSAAQIIRKALDAYRIRCWSTGLRCPCKCMGRIPWSFIKIIGYEELCKRASYWCLMPPQNIEAQYYGPKKPLDVFCKKLQKNQLYINKSVDRIRQIVHSWGDEYVAALLTFRRFSAVYRLPSGKMYSSTWLIYTMYKLSGKYPATVAVMEQWPMLQAIPPSHVFYRLFADYTNIHNSYLRELLGNPKNTKVSRTAAAQFAMDSKSVSPLVSLVRQGGFKEQVTHFHWSLVVFWTVVRAKMRAWRFSHSLKTRIPYTFSEPFELLLLRNPAKVPRAAYALSTAIHRDPEAFLRHTFACCKSGKEEGIVRWVRWIAQTKSADSERALAKIWRTCSRTNMKWYFTFANLLLDAPTSHTRLLLSVLHQSLSRPAQFSMEMNALFWKCMRSPVVRPKIVAKFLCISNLRNSWQADGHHAFHELLSTPAIQANIHAECVCKEIKEYLSSNMVHALANMETRDRIQQRLWESRSVQTWYEYMRTTNHRILYDFLHCVPARWWAKKERRVRRQSALLTTPAFRTLAIRSSYKWRTLQTTCCPICMEDKIGSMIPLHMEMRHGICKECRDSVKATTNCCPLCRIPLSAHTDSFVEPVYEDEYYDDDQMYHYD